MVNSVASFTQKKQHTLATMLYVVTSTNLMLNKNNNCDYKRLFIRYNVVLCFVLIWRTKQITIYKTTINGRVFHEIETDSITYCNTRDCDGN